MSGHTRSNHDFCWINILSPDPAKAKDFFARVLGWTYTEIPGMGWSIKVGGKDIGGLFDAKIPDGSPHPPMIGVMVKVESADVAGEKVRKLGGKAQPAFDVGPQGRMTVCYDPAGANFDVWQPKALKGTEVDPAAHGAPSWFECLSDDFDATGKFYADLFGWDPELMPYTPMRYMTFKHEGAEIAGMMQLSETTKGTKPGWGTYFTVDDVEESFRLATRLGAVARLAPKIVPGIGCFAALTSPQGVEFCVITYDPSTPD